MTVTSKPNYFILKREMEEMKPLLWNNSNVIRLSEVSVKHDGFRPHAKVSTNIQESF